MSTGVGVNTGGNVRINDLCQIGIGASIRTKLRLKNTIIGGGAFVNKNCDSNSTYFGVPAKKLKLKFYDICNCYRCKSQQ